nr:MAG TPA: hypothetical protein [Caudoviricetes sp.]
MFRLIFLHHIRYPQLSSYFIIMIFFVRQMFVLNNVCNFLEPL